MSMTTLVILQSIKIFAAYTGITVILPLVMFRAILRGRRLSEQFLMSYTFGNFYIINIVFALQLLHISNVFTLVFVTAALSFYIGIKANKISLTEKLKVAGDVNRRVMQETMSTKRALYRVGFRFKIKIQRAIRYLYKKAGRNTLQIFFFILLLYFLFWIYGRQMIISYGYHASDIPVHMEWINQMERGNLFSDGVYPFGYHCMIYYLRVVFGIDLYVLMCRFSFIQVIFIHIVLFAALKMLCQSKYMPYVGMVIYIVPGFFANQIYNRYLSALPQEFGMIFVIPVIYFLIQFFKQKKEELDTKETRLILQCFAMAFSLTLAIHFYGTIIAGICCVGIGLGFCTRFFKKEYFRKIMFTGIISILLAILPMGIAFVMGTPMQGSIGWGMNVINGTAETQGASEGEQESAQDIKDEKKSKPSTIQKIQKVVKYNIFSPKKVYKPYRKKGPYVVIGIIGLSVCLGAVFCILRKYDQGRILLSMGFLMGMLLLLLSSKKLGIPVLMDVARSSVYFTYLLIMAGTIFFDGILGLVFMADKLIIVRSITSCLITVLVTGYLFENHMFRRIDFESNYIRNGTIICLSNIIHENKDRTWTVVSANDGLQMVMDHGWHYESIDFLRKMENWKETSKVQIPTHKIYIFIEKMPVDNYYIKTKNNGRSISKKNAALPVPKGDGIEVYQKKNRNIVMSKMYYWAKAFKSKYPNELKVYYESDEFICYEISQNTYYRYNFAIDYGYNQSETQEEKE